jgi:Flp pilus assembly protein TadG
VVRRGRQAGQSIVLVALVLTVLFGFLGLAMDGGRGYLDRRHVQGSVDAGALAAAYDYMNNHDYARAEQAAVSQYATNERLYGTPACSGYGTVDVSCTFGDATNQALSIHVVDHSIAGVTFTVTGVHQIAVAVMQVLGAGPGMRVGATATALARQPGQNGAAIQTLSPGNCNGSTPSLVFTGTSSTAITGDVWSDGSISDNGAAAGSVNGNIVDVCPGMPPSPLPNFTVTGAQANGFNIPDPGYPESAWSPTARTWISTNGATELPGTYAADPHLTGGAGCYFLSGGVYDFAAGFTDNGGFVSNNLRPPDEPVMSSPGVADVTTLTSALSGTITSMAVAALPGAVPDDSPVSVGGQTFIASATAAAGATTIRVDSQAVSGSIPAGNSVTVRSLAQFWDSNGVGCAGSFSLALNGSDSNNPPVNAQTWAVELTAVRWAPNGVASCSGPASPACYLRESAPSMCRTVTPGSNQNFKVSVSSSPPLPGAQYFNVYIAPSGSCAGPFGYAATFANSGGYGMTINGSTLAGWSLNPGGALDSPGAPPPDGLGMPLATGMPNADPAAATPPHGDLANASHCVDPATGVNVACPSAWTVGAVQFFIPGGNQSTCLNLQGGGDVYVYSGYQYQRILLFEPGPEQAPPPNTCLNNVAGHGFTSLIGIFYVPAASVTIIGSSNYLATIAGGVIAWTATVKGNGGVSIMADPTLRTWPSTVRLTQ